MEATFRKATEQDARELATLNKQLREDEKMDNEMSDKDVFDRMVTFIIGETYDVYVLSVADKIAGYCVIDITRTPQYIRQLFVSRDCRHHGYGKLLITKTMEACGISDVDLEVMAWNTNATQFYEHLGFTCRYLGMRLTGFPQTDKSQM